MNGATIIFKTSIFHKIYNENLNFTQNLSALNMAQFCFQAFLTLLLLLGIFIFRHKYKKKRGESIWLFDLCSFFILCCYLFAPLVSVSDINIELSNFFPGLFALMPCAFCLFVCGLFTHDRGLKICSFIYLLFAVVVLVILGGIYTLTEFRAMELGDNPSRLPYDIYSIGLSFLFYVYPSIGYLGLGLWLRRKNKNISERQQQILCHLALTSSAKVGVMSALYHMQKDFFEIKKVTGMNDKDLQEILTGLINYNFIVEVPKNGIGPKLYDLSEKGRQAFCGYLYLLGSEKY